MAVSPPIWRGFSAPFFDGDRGVMRPLTDEKLIKFCILGILLTPRGARRNRPDFGTLLPMLLFEPADEVVAGNITTEIRNAITAFEPRVTIRDVTTVWNQDLRGYNTTIEVIINATPNKSVTLGLVTTAGAIRNV